MTSDWLKIRNTTRFLWFDNKFVTKFLKLHLLVQLKDDPISIDRKIQKPTMNQILEGKTVIVVDDLIDVLVQWVRRGGWNMHLGFWFITCLVSGIEIQNMEQRIIISNESEMRICSCLVDCLKLNRNAKLNVWWMEWHMKMETKLDQMTCILFTSIWIYVSKIHYKNRLIIFNH